MHRFRKKSDAKQQQQASPRGTSFAGSVHSNSSVLDIAATPTQSPVQSSQPGAQIGLPLLPQVNDFRSSLIIPTLSRRFTVLRESQGEATFDSLRNKFAEQRAAGAENQITEEEEDLMLDALDHISRSTGNDDSGGDRTPASYYGRAVGPPSPPITPNGQRVGSPMAFPSSPSTASINSALEPAAADASGSRTNKRRSNNLFGAGRLRDQNYIRTARANSGTSQTSMSIGSRSRYQSFDTSSTSSTATASSTVVREPSNSTLSSIRIQEASKEEEDGLEVADASAATAALATLATLVPAEDSLALSLTIPEPNSKQHKRLSMALQDALMSIAPEGDDDIVVAPRAIRSPTPGKTNGAQNGKPALLHAALFPADGAEPRSASPPSAISDEFDSASALWSGDDVQFSVQKSEWHDESHNGMSASPPPPQPTAFAAAATRPSNFNAFRQRSPSPARADSTTPRAISPPGFPPANTRAPQQSRAPQLSASILPRSALPRNDSPAPGLHAQAKSSSSYGSLAEMVRGFSRLDSATSEQDDHPYPLGKSSTRPTSPPQQARSPTPNSSSHGTAAAYYQNQLRGMDSQRTGIVTPDYSRERWGSMSMSDESVIDPYRNQPYASQVHGRTKSMASSRSLSSPPLPESPTLDAMPSSAGGADYGSLTVAWDTDNGYTPQQQTMHGRAGSMDVGNGVNGGSRPGTPRSPPFLARSPSRGGYGHRTMTPEPEYAAQATAAAASVRHFSASPPPAPSPGVGRPRTPSRSRYHSPPSSVSGSYSNINSAASNPLVLAPFNASAASVASAGSSYHSDAGNGVDDAALQALLSPDPAGRKRKWDDFTNDPVTFPRKIDIEREDGQGFEVHEPVDVLRGVLGMNKDDILAIQTTLLQVILQVKDTVDPPPRRAPSLRRRRGSVGESISSRTTSPAPGGQHVSPKNSMSPFNTSAMQQHSSILLSMLSSVSTSPSRSFSPPAPPSAPTSPGPEPPSSPDPFTGSETERERTPGPRNHFGMARSDRGRALLTSMMESIESHKPNHQDPNPAAAVRQHATQLPSNLPAATPMADSSSSNDPLLLSDLRPRSPPVQTTPPLQQPSQHEQRRSAQPVASPSSQIPLNFARPLSPQLQSPSRAMSPIQPASDVVTPARALSPPPPGPWSPSLDDSPPRALSPVGTKAQHSLTASQSSDLSFIIRNQALADAIFGPNEDESPLSAAQAQSLRSTPTPDEELDLRLTAPALFEHTPSPYDQSQSDHVSSQAHPHHVEPSPPYQQRFATPSPGPYEQYNFTHSPNKLSYNSSSSPLPPDDAQLEQDVRRRVEQATAALKSASQVSLRERSNSVKRKKINTNKISGPQLMSASTSVDAMPSLTSPSPALSSPGGDGSKSTGSKFSQRLKKLGTWRNKPATPTPEEPQPQHAHNLSPYSPGSSTPTGAFHQSVRVNSHVSELSGPASASLADVNHYRLPANSPGHSPPASAGPAFRSFVSRLGKPFGASSTDLQLPRSERERERVSPHHYAPPASPKSPPTSPTATSYINSARSPPELRRADSAQSGRYPGARVASPLGEPLPRGRHSIDEVAPRSPEQALQTIYVAASQAGLNPDAMEELSALLNRSMSNSSRAPTTEPRQTSLLSRDSFDPSSVLPQTVVERQRTIRASGLRDKKAAISRSNTARDEDTRSIVVRRTVYLASDGTPAIPTDNRGQNLNRRPSHMSHRRQSSDAGVSVRSSKLAYDGANSPPPRALSRAMSMDTPPPMPDFNPAYLDAPSAGLAGGSDSSMLELYGDSRAGTPARDRHLSVSPYPASRRSADRGPGADTGGQALEVLELADGRVVWQVVDGLRDDWDADSEVDFRSRGSFDSGHSQEHEPDLTLHLREHRRGGSKGSMSSAMLQRKPTYNRPQTKVFYSDAEHIGRLIESMTRGIDSGSFTVQHNGVPALPPPLPGRGSFDQDGNWTMEEHLEHVLQHVSPKSGPRAI